MKQKKLSSTTILMYVFAVVFLIFFIYYLYSAYEVIGTVRDSGQDVGVTDIISTYISGCSPYLFYSIACYGLGHLISNKD